MVPLITQYFGLLQAKPSSFKRHLQQPCVLIWGFTVTFTRNQDATVKLKSEGDKGLQKLLKSNRNMGQDRPNCKETPSHSKCYRFLIFWF